MWEVGAECTCIWWPKSCGSGSISCVNHAEAVESAYLEADSTEIPQRPEGGRHGGGVVELEVVGAVLMINARVPRAKPNRE